MPEDEPPWRADFKADFKVDPETIQRLPSHPHKAVELIRWAIKALALNSFIGSAAVALAGLLAGRSAWPPPLNLGSVPGMAPRYFELVFAGLTLLAYGFAGRLAAMMMKDKPDQVLPLPFARESLLRGGIRVLGWWTLIKACLAGLGLLAALLRQPAQLADAAFWQGPDGLRLACQAVDPLFRAGLGLALVRLPLERLQELEAWALQTLNLEAGETGGEGRWTR
jgi:hypothetical protein